ncbi:hypothetical protein ACIGFK_04280 [Streptomyces sp. NPDC085524]|uniref:hypothetical protein n=1 Tax=unclassified Streptomyces TaxID=2593676 RepID=UPI0035D7360A
MRPKRLNPTPVLLLFVVAVSAWAGWLGWDQHRDVHPDGSVTGPYEAWQVIGLVLTLSAAVAWATLRGHATSAVLGVTAGLTVACAYDWSDDSSGLFALGVVMVMGGTFAATSALSALITHMTRNDDRRGRA